MSIGRWRRAAMRSRGFNARDVLVVASLVPSILVAGMWARSYWRHDSAERQSRASYLAFNSVSGWIYAQRTLGWVNDLRDNPRPVSDWRFRHRPVVRSEMPDFGDRKWLYSNFGGT